MAPRDSALRQVLFASLASLLLGGAGGCDGLWPLDAPYDPRRCEPRCAGSKVCFEGECVDAPVDGGVDAAPDGPLPDAPLQDLNRAETGGGDLQPDAPATDLPVADGPAPDQKQAKPDGPAPDKPGIKVDGPKPDQPAPPPDGPQSDQPGTSQDIYTGDLGICAQPTYSKSCKGDELGMTWCAVPAGCFYMGAMPGDSCNPTNEDRRRVTLTHAIEITAFEVTGSQYRAVMGANPSSKKCGEACPVDNVTWHQAAAFANALSAARGLTPCYDCTTTTCAAAQPFLGSELYLCPGYRLPTEAEWEHAYRAGGKDQLYTGSLGGCGTLSPAANKIAWYAGNASMTTHVAGDKQPNKLGLYDMAGNVAEWVHDAYKAKLGNTPANDPVQAGAGNRVTRGGSHSHLPRDLRASARISAAATYAGGETGFRLVRTTDTPGGWVPVPRGKFFMGSPKSPLAEPCRNTNEERHQVHITRSYEVQVTEVTQGAFTGLMGYSPYDAGPASKPPCFDTCPAENITWHEIAAYCNALSKARGLPACYACTGAQKTTDCKDTPYPGKKLLACPGYRLPTDAEWERAYRAGTTTALYNGTLTQAQCSQGNAAADAIAWYNKSTPFPVGGKKPNAWGLYDMAGNVWEWTWDWNISKLGFSLLTDPMGGGSGTEKIVRGGSFLFSAGNLRAARRSQDNPLNRGKSRGGRCVRTLLPGVLDQVSIPVVQMVGDQRVNDLVFDGENFVVLWRAGASATSRVYATRVSQTGKVLDKAGIQLRPGAGNEWHPAAAHNGRHTLVAWADYRHKNWDFYATRLDRNGKVLEPKGIEVVKASGEQTVPRVASDGAGFMVAWRDHRGLNREVYGGRVDAAGKVVDAGGKQIHKGPLPLDGTVGLAWNGSDFLVTWNAKGGASAYDIFGAHVDSSFKLLNLNAVTVSGAIGAQLTPAQAGGVTQGTALVAWLDNRASTQGLYGAMVSYAKGPSPKNGTMLAPGGNVVAGPSIAAAGQEYLVVWADKRNASSDIYAARVAHTGALLDSAGLVVAAVAPNQTTPRVVRGNREYLVVWSQWNNTDWDIHAARVAY